MVEKIRGQVFSCSDLWERLPEDYGVVVLVRNGHDVAYGDAHSLLCEKDTLEKNFIGAKFMYGAGKVYLIRKENGVLVRQR